MWFTVINAFLAPDYSLNWNLNTADFEGKHSREWRRNDEGIGDEDIDKLGD